MEPAHQRAIREQLAQLLKEPLERVAGGAWLRNFRRYDTSVLRELMKAAQIELSPEVLRSVEKVQDIVDALSSRASARQRGVTRPATPRVPPLPAPAASALEPLDAGRTADPAPPAPEGSFESPNPYEEERIGAAAVYCSDGRVGDQVDDFLHHGLSLPRYDRVACPGGPIALAGRLMAFWESRGVEEQVRFLIRAHGLRQVVLIAHQGCAYYRERLGISAASLEAEQRKDLDTAAWAVRRMEDGLKVQAFFARRLESQIRFEPVGAPLDAHAR